MLHFLSNILKLKKKCTPTMKRNSILLRQLVRSTFSWIQILRVSIKIFQSSGGLRRGWALYHYSLQLTNKRTNFFSPPFLFPVLSKD